jgi:hypothetical protein
MIPLVKEPSEMAGHFWGEVERCHFCKKATRMWHENTNNPVCEKCAKEHRVSELPDHGKIIRAQKRKERQINVSK